MKRLIMFLLIFSFIPCFSETGSFGYEDYKIGESKSKISELVEIRYNWNQINYKERNIYTDCNDIVVKTGSAPSEKRITFQFDKNEKLYLIIVSFENPKNTVVNSIIEELTKKYGKPSSKDSNGLPEWYLENKKYTINFTVLAMTEPVKDQKYSHFTVRYGDVKIWNVLYGL
jgi:hypothetical protein